MENVATGTPLEVFCSYAHTDEALVRDMLTSFDSLVHSGLLTIWQDRQITAGDEWVNEIDLHLNTSQIILLFVSPAFLASHYCHQIELPRAPERAQRREAHVIPILLEPIDLSSTSFGHLQALPPRGRYLSAWNNKAEAKREIASHIEDLAHTIMDGITRHPVQRARFLNQPSHRNPYFTGREEVLEQLHRSLDQHHTSALVQAITGLGGIGKTQTAVEYAYRYQQEYDTILWVNAESIEALITDYTRLAHLLALPEREEKVQSLVTQAVIRWMEAQKHWLLILDNVEDLDTIRNFLPYTGNEHLLLTTRSQMVGEFASPVLVDAMETETGALLLLRRAKLIAPSLTIYTPSLPPQLREDALTLTQELGGLPLALDQAAAYIEATNCSIADYLELYTTNRSRLLATRGPFGKDHPASVVTTWSLSFERVQQQNPAAADLLRLCAFLAPDAIPESIITKGATHVGSHLAALGTDAYLLDQAIESLGAYSLVRRDPREKSLSIHRLVQAVLQDSMDQPGEKQWAECAVQVTNAAFPDVELASWPQCERLLPHGLVCSDLIKKYQICHLEAARLLDQVGYYLYERARYREAELLKQQALSTYLRLSGPNHPDTASSLDKLATLYYVQGKYEQAEPLYERALNIYEQQMDPKPFLIAQSLNNLAALYQVLHKYEQAESFYQRALIIYEQQREPEHLNTAQVLNNLAWLFHSQDKYAQAEPLYRRALAIRERYLAPEHPSIAQSLNSLAGLYTDQMRYAEAEPLYQRALAIFQQKLGLEHPDTAQIWWWLATLALRQGKLAEAKSFYEHALQVFELRLGVEHPRTSALRRQYEEMIHRMHKS